MVEGTNPKSYGNTIPSGSTRLSVNDLSFGSNLYFPASFRGLDHYLNTRLIVLVKGFENGGCGNCTFVFLRNWYSVVCTTKLRCPVLCASCTRVDPRQFPLLSPEQQE